MAGELVGAVVQLVGEHSMHEGAAWTRVIAFTETGGGVHQLSDYSAFTAAIATSDDDSTTLLSITGATYFTDLGSGRLQISIGSSDLTAGMQGGHVWSLYGTQGAEEVLMVRRSRVNIQREATP